ncbi:hypothetical protein EDD22DRAFT_960378 [Suillus occidentalis]|nr:hypothetical protein EDD22DRAFT_960378 [Suillus occidentalis]
MITTQVLRSVPSVRVVSHAKIESSLAPVIPKCNALHDFPKSSMPPCAKKCKFRVARSKRKADEDIPQGTLLPSSKKLCRSYAIADLTVSPLNECTSGAWNIETQMKISHRAPSFPAPRSFAVHMRLLTLQPTQRMHIWRVEYRNADEDIPQGTLLPSFKKLCRSYAIADLKAHSTNAHLARGISQEHLKRKAYGDTPDDFHPPGFKKRTFSRSYAIADLAYSATDERTVDPVLFVSGMSVALALTARAACSHWPFANELVLMIFQYLPATDLRSITQVSCLSRDLAAPLYLHSVGLHVGQTWLRVNAQSCLALLLYTRMTSFCAPRFLRCDLLGTGNHDLTALKIFLQSLKGVQDKHISSVICFDAPPGVDLASLFQLVKDLGCSSFRYSSTEADHPCTVVPAPSDPGANVDHLWIHPGSTLSPKLQDYSSQKVSRQPSQPIPNPCLLHLNVLGGPPWYLISLLATIHSAPSIPKLSLRFEEDFTSNYFSAVLDVARHFASIQELQLSFFDASHTASHFEVPCDEVRTVASKQLTISVHGSDPDVLLSSCRPWLEAFQMLENVELQAKCTSPEKLEELFSCPDNSFQLKISNVYW